MCDIREEFPPCGGGDGSVNISKKTGCKEIAASSFHFICGMLGKHPNSSGEKNIYR